MAAVDVFVIGAGPAGLAAALRLRQLGLEVALLERNKLWPRPQIGEAMTIGIRSIFESLDAKEALAALPQLPPASTQASWRNPEFEALPHSECMVLERAAMDDALLTLARTRGVHVLHPAQPGAVTGGPGAWQIAVRRAPGAENWSARFILDARGRHGNAASHVYCAPRLLASWAEFDIAPDQTGTAPFPPGLLVSPHVAALEQGWLWGIKLPRQRYRVLLLCDPVTPHKLMPGQPAAWLRQQLRQNPRFAPLAELPFAGNFHAGCATPYFASDFWRPGCIKIGDCAFALDPVSSSGVEKAMRFALHAASAVNTILLDDKVATQEMAHAYLQQRLLDTCARHNLWAQRHYRQVWCHDAPFWQQRAQPFAARTRDPEAQSIAQALQQEEQRLRHFKPPAPNQGPMLRAWQHIRFPQQLTFVKVACAVHERVQLQDAIAHPALERPLTHLENEALLPRLAIIRQQPSLSEVLELLAMGMSMAKAQRMLGWLWTHGLLEAVD
jgi:flavin-dependent dehydrogenase